jgi:hypothetical protein
VILQGRPVSEAERQALALGDGALISVDRKLICAIKEML